MEHWWQAQKNFSNSEVKVLLQKVNAQQLVLFIGVSSGVQTKRCMGCDHAFS